MTTSYSELRSKDFGAKHEWIKDGLISAVTPVTIRAWNWIPVKTCGTFLYSETNLGWFGVDNAVTMTSFPADAKYQFNIVKCSGVGIVNYGDTVALRSIGTGKYMQCGAGTCSGVDAIGCTPDSWQSFTIESTEGKTGQVNFGDPVRIRQVVGTKCAITAAGNKTTWCTDGSENNSYMVILPSNGSVYIDPARESAYYTNNLRDKDFAKFDPPSSNVETFGNTIKNIFDDYKNMIMVVVMFIFAIIIALILRNRTRGPRYGGEEILTDVMPTLSIPTMSI